LGKAVFCGMLAFASLSGLPLRAEEVEELMQSMNRPKLAHTIPENAETGDDLLKKLLGDQPAADSGRAP
jgi:hypothetical protein